MKLFQNSKVKFGKWTSRALVVGGAIGILTIIITVLGLLGWDYDPIQEISGAIAVLAAAILVLWFTLFLIKRLVRRLRSHGGN